MRAHRIDALLLLNEDEAVGVLDIDMAMMRQTPRLTPRSRAMLGAERDHALAMFGGHDDLAGDEDHDVRSFSAFVGMIGILRSDERRGGKEVVSTCRSR